MIEDRIGEVVTIDVFMHDVDWSPDSLSSLTSLF